MLPGASAEVDEWTAWIPKAATLLSEALDLNAHDKDAEWWLGELERRIASILALLCDCMPWLLPEYAPLRDLRALEMGRGAEPLSVEKAIEFAQRLEEKLAGGWEALPQDAAILTLAVQLRETLPIAVENLRALATGLRSIADRAATLADGTEFGFLVHPYTQMLSVAYDADAKKLFDACYDMLASEARIATFLAVARGDLPQESWFKLARDHGMAYGRLALLSWTGTMFEYLMPSLWMRSYPHTLIAGTLQACVYVQREFAAAHSIPWGISECGYASRDGAGHYSYQAFGVPQIALKFDATAGPVVSPYSAFLALGVDSVAALRNLRQLASAGMVGAYGFYEAMDFTQRSGKPVPVREWMAHHHGMSLLAILNLLCDNVVQEWFHSNPLLKSAELVLHEMPQNKAFLMAKLKEFADIRPGAAAAA
jgi:cyclic beta-1,2-glucan synthetase